MMMADALIDIPSIRRIDKLENVQGRRHSTGKVIMPSGGLTVLSRYLRASQASCHDMCKYGTGFSPETESKIPRCPIGKIVAPKRDAGRNPERVSESNLGGRRRKKSEISGHVSPDCKIRESDEPVVINIEQTQGHHLENVEENLTDTNNSKVGVKPSDDDLAVINIEQTQGHHLQNVEEDLTDTKNSKVCVRPSDDAAAVINIAQTQGRHLENIEEDLIDTKSSKVCVEPSDGAAAVINIAQTQGRHLENIEEDLIDTKNSKVDVGCSDDDPVVINISQTQGHHLENIEEDLTDTKNSKVGVEPSGDDPVVINISQTQGHHLQNIEEDLTDTKNSKVDVEPSDDCEPKSPEYPAISVRPSCEDPVDIEATAAEGEAEYEETAETKSLRGEKEPQVCMKSSPDSESQKPIDLKCAEGEISSWTDKESVLPQRVLLSIEETNYEVAHGKDSKPKPSSLIRQACSSGKQNPESPKREEVNIKSMTGDMTMSKGIRTYTIGDKKNVVVPSVSFSPRDKTNKCRNVNRSKKQEKAKQVKPEKLQGKNAKRSDNVRGVSHLTGLNHVKKLHSEQAKFANISETSLYLAESNPENKPAESDQNNVVSIGPSSSSKYKSMKQNQNRTPIVRAPRPYEKKNMIYKPKGIHAGGLPPSLSSFPGRKSLRPTPNGLNIIQPSLASSSLLASLMSSHNDTSAEHDKIVAEKQKSSSKMMYKARPKKASMITPNNKHLPGKQLNFQRVKVVEIPVEDCTPRRLTFKKRELVDNRNDDNRKGKFENFSTRRLNFRQRANLDNIHADNQNGRVKEFTPRRLKFRRREIVDNRDGDNQNSKIEEFSPRRLEFRRKLIVDNINGAGQNGSVEEFSLRKLEFRRKLIVHNINGDGQNGSVEEFSPRKLEFRRKLIVHNINGDNQNGRVEEFSPRKLEFSRSVLDNRNADDQNVCGEDSSPRKLIFMPKVVDEKKIGYIQKTKGSPTKNNFGRTEGDFAWHNGTKIRSEKNSLSHRDNTEKKGSGILYNNIIEEAASRLASTKASKVKALVSAFETVISHLDGGISDTDNRN